MLCWLTFTAQLLIILWTVWSDLKNCHSDSVKKSIVPPIIIELDRLSLNQSICHAYVLNQEQN